MSVVLCRSDVFVRVKTRVQKLTRRSIFERDMDGGTLFNGLFSKEYFKICGIATLSHRQNYEGGMENMQKKDQPFEPWIGYYKIEYLDKEPKVAENTLFDTVFSKLEKIQRQVMLKRIKEAESRLTSLEASLNFFLAKDGR